MKHCKYCDTVKPLDEFHNCKDFPDGKTYGCKDCQNERARKHHNARKNDPEYKAAQRDRYIKRTHGITAKQYDTMLTNQNYKCAICETRLTGGTQTHLDHDHHTGELRSMLCTNCNRGLGYFSDSPNMLSKAAEYLKRWASC